MEIKVEFVLLIVFFLTVFIQLIYHWVVFARLSFFKKKTKQKEYTEPVSVIISSRDEYFNLKQFLPLVLNQNYPEYEVVLVNDNSTDETSELLEELTLQHKHLKVISLDQELNFFTGKKFPLSIGIKSAKYDLLLLTDADCKPNSDNWIREMVSNFDDETDLVLGYGTYFKKKSFLNFLIRFDAFWNAVKYLSFANAGMPFKGVGRNLAYRKDTFFTNNGFISHYSMPYGDDDLFVNQVANKKNTKIEIATDSYTISQPRVKYNNWFKQKRTAKRTFKHYKFKHRFALNLFSASLLLMYALLICLLVLKMEILLVLSVLGLKLISQLIVNKLLINKFKESNYFLLSPLIEIVLLLINMTLVITSPLFKKS